MARLQLPVVSKELVATCAVEAASATGEAEQRDAQQKLAWAFAHSEVGARDAGRAVELLGSLRREAAARGDGGMRERELCYLTAVAHYRMSELAAAKAWCEKALKAAPSCRQSVALLAECENTLAEDALYGIAGAGAILAGAVLLGAALLGGGKSSRGRSGR
jgi:hypothetical protein